MKKNGFTLIEIIAAIIIIGIIATTVAVSFRSIMNKNTSEKYNEFKREIEEAACVYIDLNENKGVKSTCYSSGTCNVTVKSLVKNGLVDEKLVNPETGEKVNQNLVVQIKWNSDKTKKCTLQ